MNELCLISVVKWLFTGCGTGKYHSSYQSLPLHVILSKFHPSLILATCFPKVTFSVICLLLVVLRLGLEQLEVKIWFSELSYVLVNWFEL